MLQHAEAFYCSPFSHFLRRCPWHIKRALLDADVYAVQPDGEFLKKWIDTDPSLVDQLVEQMMSKLPQPVPVGAAKDLRQVITHMVSLVDSGQQTSTYSSGQLSYLPDMRRRYRLQVELNEAPIQLSKWRHYKPRELSALEPCTQRATEQLLISKWTVRLLRLLTPFTDTIPNMSRLRKSVLSDPKVQELLSGAVVLGTSGLGKASGATGPDDAIPGIQDVLHQEYSDMLGATRFGTLRAHCLTLERALRLKKDLLPWSEDTLRMFLNDVREAEWRPSAVQRFWKTAKFLNSKLGMLDPDKIEVLKSKKDAVRNDLIREVLQPCRKAQVPSLDCVVALERGTSEGTLAERHLCGFARFLVGSSSRFNDGQHTQMATLERTLEVLQARAWQTKTMSILENRQRPKVLVAPLHSFSGIDWAANFLQSVQSLRKSQVFMEADYLLPAVTSDKNGLIPRPMKNSQGLRWLRSVLISKGLPHKEVDGLTWPSLRVFMGDWAYRAGISRDRRRYIGQWAEESTADVYTRNHATVICGIWKEVLASSFPAGSGTAPRQVDEEVALLPDLGKRQSSFSPQFTSPDKRAGGTGASGPDMLPVCQEREASGIVMNLDEQDVSAHSPTLSAAAEDGVWEVLEAQQPEFHAMVTLRKSGRPPSYLIHLFNDKLVSVGCGWAGHRSCSALSQEDYEKDRDLGEDSTMRKCKRCFQVASFSWDLPGKEAGDGERDLADSCSEDSDEDSSSDSASDNDTASEAEAYKGARP